MVGDTALVGFLNDGVLSEEQRAAMEWLQDGGWRGRSVEFSSLSSSAGGEQLEQVDVLWWHREAPVADGLLGSVAGPVEEFLDASGRLLLTCGAMTAVDQLAVESVPPDALERERVTEPTGFLWRSQYDDHPAPTAFDSLRIPVRASGEVTVTRYERILPERGEILASTLRDGRDCPDQMTVVSWQHGAGSVLGVGGYVSFTDAIHGAFAENRERLLAACLGALAHGHPHPGRPKDTAEIAAMRDSLADDPNRPGYHVTPPANWLNDPNGLVEWEGRYHLFYQYNPGGPFHNTIHWGHVVSDDLLTWRDEPVALSPSPDGADRDGCWSGCAVDDAGTARIMYTGGADRKQLPCLATADSDDLRRWTKYEDNPVITEVPGELDIAGTEQWEAEFRDHCLWQEDGTWHQLIGSGIQDSGGAVLLYTAENLREWEYQGPLLVEDNPGSGAIWECPELLDLGEKQLLHVSNYEEVLYFLGEMHGGRFEVDHSGVLDHGDFYAPQSMTVDGRTLTWGWLTEAREQSAQWDAGWSGALSVPRELSLGPDGRLRQHPAERLQGLRAAQLPVPESVALASESHRFDAGGRQLELRFDLELDDAAACELGVLESADGSERTAVRYSREGVLSVDRSAAGGDGTESQRMDVPPYDEPLSLHVFVDGSVVELYANERHCLTSRVYPTDPAADGLSVTAEEGRATLRSLSAWRLQDAFQR